MNKRRISLLLLAAGLVCAASILFFASRQKLDAPAPVVDYVQNAEKNAREGRITAAVVDYNRGIALAPKDARPYIGLAVLYEALNRPDLAVETLQQLEAANPDAPHLLCRLAEAHLGAEDTRRTREIGEKAVAREPDCARAFSVYGIALARRRYWDSSAQALDRARQLAPDDAQIGEVLVEVRLRQGAYPQAIAVAEALLRHRPDSAKLNYQAGFAYARAPLVAGAMAKAEQHLRRAAELNPKWFEPLAELGRLHRAQGRSDDALAAFEQAWNLNDRVPGVAFNLAALYRQKGRPQAAAMERRYQQLMKNKERFTALRRAYNQDSDVTENILSLAEAEGKLGLYGAALHRLRKALSADPANMAALRLYVRLDREVRSRYPDYLRPGPGIGPPEL